MALSSSLTQQIRSALSTTRKKHSNMPVPSTIRKTNITDHHTTNTPVPSTTGRRTLQTIKFGVHHPTTRQQSIHSDTPTCHIEQNKKQSLGIEARPHLTSTKLNVPRANNKRSPHRGIKIPTINYRPGNPTSSTNKEFAIKLILRRLGAADPHCENTASTSPGGPHYKDTQLKLSYPTPTSGNGDVNWRYTESSTCIMCPANHASDKLPAKNTPQHTTVRA